MANFVLLIALAAFCATLLGGLFALKLKDRLHLILGFSAGAVLAVAFFDLLPEALELGAGTYTIGFITSFVALGFVVYMVLDRAIVLHADQEANHHHRGTLGAGSLALHSFFDGIALGLAFHVSNRVGMTVAIAVCAHDFSDGINTVNLVLKNGGARQKALQWLILDAAAPIGGVLATALIVTSGPVLGLMLALFCGFFTYIGASDLLPESHHSHPTKWTTVTTIIGLAVVYAAIHLAG